MPLLLYFNKNVIIPTDRVISLALAAYLASETSTFQTEVKWISLQYKKPIHMPEKKQTTYKDLREEFANDVRDKFQVLQTEIEQRNEEVTARDDFVYGDRLERSLS